MTILLRRTTGHPEVKKVSDIDIILSGRSFGGQNGAYCPRTVQRSVIPERAPQREENGNPVGPRYFVPVHAVASGKFPGASLHQFFNLFAGRCPPGPAPGDLGPEEDIITIGLGGIGPDIPVGPEDAEADVNGARILDAEGRNKRRKRRLCRRDIDSLAVIPYPENAGVSLDEEDQFITQLPQIQDPAIRAHKNAGLNDIAETAQFRVRFRPFYLLEDHYA